MEQKQYTVYGNNIQTFTSTCYISNRS